MGWDKPTDGRGILKSSENTTPGQSGTRMRSARGHVVIIYFRGCFRQHRNVDALQKNSCSMNPSFLIILNAEMCTIFTEHSPTTFYSLFGFQE